MYTAYFGLKEKPFSIAPDPQYLFMSDRHREALAHLTYGLGDAGGFVLLTGEVGTGKTTVSRCLMERLPENTQAAFILNPTLSSHELLATLCDELKIRYRKTGATLKTLTDKIQDKLLKNHKEGINTLLIIDEAQHLQPEVLEQLRLLTNLETNTKKLLQVILIGQPELQTLLKRRDLRQLAQRITARYHLLPLNKQEVAQYIKHRLSIAECIRSLFTPQAMKTIHDICGGIPRLINLVCERSLLNAYSSNMATVDKKTVQHSAEEALGDDYKVHYWWQSLSVRIGVVVGLIILTAIGAYYVGKNIEKQFVDNTETLQKETSVEIKENQIKSSEIEQNKNPEAAEVKGISKTDSIEQEVSDVIEEKNNALSTTTLKQGELSHHKLEKVEPSQNNKVKEIAQETVTELNKPFELQAVEGVPEDLLNRFKDAIDEEDPSKNSKPNHSAMENEIVSIEEMPLWVQNGIPELQFEQHIYASDGSGWIKVNGRDRYEGDSIARELILVQILPQKVILNFRGEKFTMRALSSW